MRQSDDVPENKEQKLIIGECNKWKGDLLWGNTILRKENNGRKKEIAWK